MSAKTVPCRRCGNPREINAYCIATEECRRAADESAAAIEEFVRIGDRAAASAVPGTTT